MESYNNSKRRQEFPEIFFNNGAFYGCSVEFFQQKKVFYNEDSELLIMNERSLIDIDTAFDMQMARALV
jgi:CMP-N-acetylneuraminic acid synthetase